MNKTILIIFGLLLIPAVAFAWIGSPVRVAPAGSDVPLADAGAYYATDTVEAALQAIGLDLVTITGTADTVTVAANLVVSGAHTATFPSVAISGANTVAFTGGTATFTSQEGFDFNDTANFEDTATFEKAVYGTPHIFELAITVVTGDNYLRFAGLVTGTATIGIPMLRGGSVTGISSLYYVSLGTGDTATFVMAVKKNNAALVTQTNPTTYTAGITTEDLQTTYTRDAYTFAAGDLLTVLCDVTKSDTVSFTAYTQLEVYYDAP